MLGTIHHTYKSPYSAVRPPEDLPLRMFGIARESIVDGPGLRFVVFVQGCPHHCAGCHNPESHNFDGGYMSSTLRIYNAICENPLLYGVTFSGGEPFMQAHALAELGRAVRERGLGLMTYSGFTYEQLLERNKTDPGVGELLAATNFLVDGPFVLSKRDLTLHFRGSSNQRILDVTCYPNSTAATQVDFVNDRLTSVS